MTICSYCGEEPCGQHARCGVNLTGAQIQDRAYREFEYWISEQSDDVQELSVLDQINLYADKPTP